MPPRENRWSCILEKRYAMARAQNPGDRKHVGALLIIPPRRFEGPA